MRRPPGRARRGGVPVTSRRTMSAIAASATRTTATLPRRTMSMAADGSAATNSGFAGHAALQPEIEAWLAICGESSTSARYVAEHDGRPHDEDHAFGETVEAAARKPEDERQGHRVDDALPQDADGEEHRFARRLQDVGDPAHQPRDDQQRPEPRGGTPAEPVQADDDRAEDHVGLLHREPARIGEEVGPQRHPDGERRRRDGHGEHPSLPGTAVGPLEHRATLAARTGKVTRGRRARATVAPA